MSDLLIPTYCLHKASGLAVVTLSGKEFYLGEYGTPGSKTEYERQVAEWLARGRTIPPRDGGKGLTVNEVMLAYVLFAETYYRDADGLATREIETMKLAFRPLKTLYGHTSAAQFGPLALEAVQSKMIEATLARRVINQRIGYIKRMFRWASRKQLIDPSVYHGLLCVDGLRRGRSAAKETEPVQPVPDAHVNAIIPFLPPILRAMVNLQRLTGMRSGELVRLRTCDIDMSAQTWLYRPKKHKTAHLGKDRIISFGPQCQAILRPLLQLGTSANLFTPKQAAAERNVINRQNRKTPVQPSQQNRRKSQPKRTPGVTYDTRSYYAALRFAMKAARKAGMLADGEFWHPHRLRHSAALRIRREMGLEAARSYLGHAKPDITEHYAGIDTALACEVAARFG